MGRAADNEQIKLRATFYNNCGVGLMVAGALIPFIQIFPEFGNLTKWMLQNHDVRALGEAIDWIKLGFAALATVAALTASMRWRIVAHDIAGTISD